SCVPKTLRREAKVKIDNFFAELKRRNVYKVAVAYAVVGWLIVQVATQVFPFFEIPNWAVRLIVLAIVIGFPIALVIAWAFELTPEGIKRTEDIDPGVDSRAKSRAWIYVVIVAALLSISLFFLGRFTASTKQNGANEVPAKSIAVLPFENLSEEKANAFFADGVQDEILTDLARIADLKVISRTSVMHYKSGIARNLREIGEQLGKAHVLQVIDLLNQAVARDPSFFQAYCRLAETHDSLYVFGFDHTSARLALADAAIEAASRLRPNDGETHLARARNIYQGYLDY